MSLFEIIFVQFEAEKSNKLESDRCAGNVNVEKTQINCLIKTLNISENGRAGCLL